MVQFHRKTEEETEVEAIELNNKISAQKKYRNLIFQQNVFIKDNRNDISTNTNTKL